LVEEEILFKRSEEMKLIRVDAMRKGRVSFPTVHGCNFNCKYCFAGAGGNYTEAEKEMTDHRLSEIMEFLYLDYFRDYGSIKFDFVSGGEPLLNLGAIRKLNGLMREFDSKYGKKSDIFLCTNGSLLDDGILAYLEDERISLGIGYDGIQRNHDEMRRFKDGGPTYDIVKGKISGIMGSRRLSAFTKKFWALGVLTSKNDSLVELLKEYVSLGITNVQLKVCKLPQGNEYAIDEDASVRYRSMYEDLGQYLKIEAGDGNLIPLLAILNNNDSFGKFLIRLILREPTTRRCGAGCGKISVCANGDVYPCDSFVGRPTFRMGNIKTGVSEGLLDEGVDIYSSKSCSVCWIRYLCGGDCYHYALISTGTLGESLSYLCELSRHVVEVCIDLVDFISNMDEKAKNLMKKTAYARYSGA
jgi:uncharacterized protein